MKLNVGLVILIGLFGLLGWSITNQQSWHWDAWFTWIQNRLYQGFNQLENRHYQPSGSRVEIVSFSSAALNGKTMQTRVYLPPQYDTTTNKRYPVLYLLHGYPGNNQDWLVNTNLQRQLDEAIRVGIIPAMLVVFPDGNGPIIRDSQYVNATQIDQAMEDYLLEVVAFIDSQYKTLPNRCNRAIGGVSSGAYGAVNIGLHHNDMFAILLSHSGYFLNQQGVISKLLGHGGAARIANDPLKYLDTSKLDPKTFVYLDIGKYDEFRSFVKQNHQFDQKLSELGIDHQFRLTGGWHNWNVWRHNIHFSLNYLGQHFSCNQ